MKLTLLYLPPDMISASDFAASFFSATFKIRTIASVPQDSLTMFLERKHLYNVDLVAEYSKRIGE